MNIFEAEKAKEIFQAYTVYRDVEKVASSCKVSVDDANRILQQYDFRYGIKRDENDRLECKLLERVVSDCELSCLDKYEQRNL